MEEVERLLDGIRTAARQQGPGWAKMHLGPLLAAADGGGGRLARARRPPRRLSPGAGPVTPSLGGPAAGEECRGRPGGRAVEASPPGGRPGPRQAGSRRAAALASDGAPPGLVGVAPGPADAPAMRRPCREASRQAGRVVQAVGAADGGERARKARTRPRTEQ
ncbi:Hypothetical predicted protein, partial [Pelobates cultripes]